MNLLIRSQEEIEVAINPEIPFVEAVGLSLVKPKDGDVGTLKLVALNHNNSTDTVPIPLRLSIDEIMTAINGVFSNARNISKLTIILESETIDKLELDINRSNNFVDIQNPLLTFDAHIKAKDNIKIVFSAPFGYGKTTFLDIYFSSQKKHLEAFNVFPVNYSVSSNEDIFKYIKCDILFQLLGKGLDFDYEEVNRFLTAQEYLLFNPKEVVKELLKASAHLNKNLSTVLNKLKGLGDAMNEYHEKQQIDDKKKAIEYIEELYQGEGSIYEDNFYTQLIRQLLVQLKEKTGKETVLVIEDLDRMDPEHIFRILNVISAHFDTYRLIEGADFEPHNKFGFDKILIVCDKSNIEKVFKHRFGYDSDFSGYFNKFYSKAPFEFRNEEALAFHINMIEKIPDEARIIEWLGPYFVATKKILHDLIYTGNLTLRELIKFSKVNLYRDVIMKLDKTNKPELYKKSFFLVLYEYLKYIDGIDNKLSKLKGFESHYTQINLDYFVKVGFVPLAIKDGNQYHYEFKKTKWKFKANDYNTPFYSVDESEFEGGLERSKYGSLEFYEILEMNINRYNEIGGLLTK